MNIIYLVGWTTKDFEGGTTAKSSIKVKRNIGKTYDYFDVVAFKETAEDCKKVKANSKVAIEGTLQKNSFGEKWYYTTVINDIRVLEKPQPKDPPKDDTIQETPNPVETFDDSEITNAVDLPDEELPF